MEEFPLTSRGLTEPSYPTSPQTSIFLPDVSGLECLPIDGIISFRYHRDELKLRGENLSAQLMLSAITDVQCVAEDDAEDEPLAKAVDKLFEEAKKEAGTSEDDETY